MLAGAKASGFIGFPTARLKSCHDAMWLNQSIPSVRGFTLNSALTNPIFVRLEI